ncbi:MAG TPA: SDR family oxidoreductase, partial [Actinomycetes bacterium]|nr:SDR family oxidoreductase [Actinomycetes bacterium]
LCKAAVPHMKPGASIIASSSVNSDAPPPGLLAYNATKAGLANMVGSLSQSLADRGIRANSVAPGPIWTPLIPATMPEDKVEGFGASESPIGRAGQDLVLFMVSTLLASLLAGHEVRLRDPSRLDPDRPLPRTLNHVTLRMGVSRSPAGLAT